MLVALTGRTPEAGGARRQWTFSRLASYAATYDLPFVMAQPKRIHLQHGDLRTEGWRAERVEDGLRFEQISLPIRRAVVWDAMYLAELASQSSAYQRALSRFRTAGVTYFNPGLPTKDVLVSTLLEPSHVWLPKTHIHLNARALTRLLDDVPALWLKPVVGSGGRNVAFVRKLRKNLYQFEAERFFGKAVRWELNKKELLQAFHATTSRYLFFAQEDVNLLTTNDGRKLDFRVTLARDVGGKWQEVGTTARIGAKGARLTNYHAGGQVLSLSNVTQSDWQYLSGAGMTEGMVQKMSRVVMDVAAALQRHYPGLGVLGIDIGLNPAGECYAYDFNTRPGRDILTDVQMERFLSCIAGFARNRLDGR